MLRTQYARHAARHHATWETDRASARNVARQLSPPGPTLDDRPWSREWGLLFSRLWIAAFGNAFEQGSGEITLGCIGQHREDHRPSRRFRGDLQGRGERSARGDAAENAFATRKGARCLDCF